MAALLRIEGLSKSFGSTMALDGADLAVESGSIVALIGANGAGKSTLVKILCGVHQADRGSITLDGRQIAPRSPREAREAGIVAVHQSIADVGVPSLPVIDNLLLDRHCGDGRFMVGGRTDRDEAAAMADAVGLDLDLDRRLDAVSIADRQLIAIARAVAQKPRLMIFDEPTASLSGRESDRLFGVIERLRGQGVAILYISHKIADLRRLADRVVVLRDGRVGGTFGQPIDFPAAIRTMVGHDIAARPKQARPLPGRDILTLRGIRLRPGDAPFDLVARAGEVLAVTGPVGAGKSSLAGTIFGLWLPVGGTMDLDGAPWRPAGPGEAIRAGVFMAGEDRWRTSFFPPVVPFAHIAGTIGFPFLARWMRSGIVDPAVEVDRAEALIRDFGIKASGPLAPLTALSGGNQQKVVLARWHAEAARVLLLDEPFQGVDIGARDDIIRAIRASSVERATLVFVNDLEEAIEVGDRVLVMADHTISDDVPREDAARLYSALGDRPAPQPPT